MALHAKNGDGPSEWRTNKTGVFQILGLGEVKTAFAQQKGPFHFPLKGRLVARRQEIIEIVCELGILQTNRKKPQFLVFNNFVVDKN